MAKVYVESTIPSYLAAFPSRDLITAGHQQITAEWWKTARERFELYISEAVRDEIHEGDSEAATRRLDLVADLPILSINDDVRALARIYARQLGLSGKALADVPHFAFSVAYEMDYLVTWNCSHIANGEMIRRLLAVNSELNRFTPMIVTPEEIMEPLEGTER